MSTILDDFVSRAKQVTVTEAAAFAGIAMTRKSHAGPCPQCGGKDRFSINPAMQAWKCRGCDTAGRDGISLMAHVLGLDTHDRSGFFEACAAALQESIPDGGARETDEQRAVRERRMADRQRLAAAKAVDDEKRQNEFRAREIAKARGIYTHATDASRSAVADYLRLRTGFEMVPAVFERIRIAATHSYWHGRDDFGRPNSIFSGPAMIAGFFAPDGVITGCHETWIDLAAAPKFRPDLGTDEKGQPLPTKKMRGTKKGSLIPCCGSPSARRWVTGEGIENVLAIAGAEGFDPSTFYAATGDLGNLAGPADARSAFGHPALLTDKARAQRIAGPVPKADQRPDDAFQVPGHVSQLVLLADGDSEPVMTASAMARAEARLVLDGRTLVTWWPPAGEDWAGAMASAIRREAEE